MRWVTLLFIYSCSSGHVTGQAAWRRQTTITGTVTGLNRAVVADVESPPQHSTMCPPNRLDQDGIYVVPNCSSPTRSSLRDGFETLLRAGITLNSNKVARIDTVSKWPTSAFDYLTAMLPCSKDPANHRAPT